MTRVGTCSLCGGNVVGHRGARMSINPPPPDRCVSCGATSASDLIKMYPKRITDSWQTRRRST